MAVEWGTLRSARSLSIMIRITPMRCWNCRRPSGYREQVLKAIGGLAIALANDGKLEEAQQELDTLQKKGASFGDCDLVAAEILSLQKNYDQALALYIKVFNEVEDPQLLSHAYLSAANAALNQDDMEKAVRILKQGCQNLPEGQAVLQKEMLADLMMQQAASDKENAEEYYAEAQQLLEELVDSGYDTIATRLNLATVLQALDQYSEAEKVLKDLQEQYPSDYRFDMQMAYLLIDQLRTSGWLK
ncbi:MAG: tetratricopeptide repeat protein [Faecalibacterium prausnitzii]|nr:tetratricopeptide repeat protein [Faecalibacterium prausnitzii]